MQLYLNSSAAEQYKHTFVPSFLSSQSVRKNYEILSGFCKDHILLDISIIQVLTEA